MDPQGAMGPFRDRMRGKLARRALSRGVDAALHDPRDTPHPIGVATAPRRALGWWWWGASLAVHGSLVAVGAARTHRLAAAPTARLAAAPVLFETPLPGPTSDLRARGLAAASEEAPPDPAQLGGVRSPQNLSATQAGERGDGRSSVQGRLLAARADGVNLDPRLANALGVTQEQRIRTARDRASPQDDRRTPNPDDDPWLATGDGVLLLRTRAAEALPAPGAAVVGPGRSPGAQSSMARPPDPHATATGPPTPASAAGGPPAPAAGLAGMTGRRPTVAGPVRTGRPALEQGHAATQADPAAQRPRDDRDADLLAQALLRGATLATVHDGPERAPGVGGVGGGGAPGAGGGAGRGGQARAFGEGDGLVSLGTDDGRYVRYFAEVRRRLHPLWAEAFPREEALRLRQGTVILHFVIARDGTVRDVRVARRSGIDRFDDNVLVAVRGARLPPIPAALARDQLRVRAPFEYRNPAVR